MPLVQFLLSRSKDLETSSVFYTGIGPRAIVVGSISIMDSVSRLIRMGSFSLFEISSSMSESLRATGSDPWITRAALKMATLSTRFIAPS